MSAPAVNDAAPRRAATRRDAFASLHPAIGFLFFAYVILSTIFVLHPVLLAASFGGAVAYVVWLRGAKALRLVLLGVLPLMLLAALINTLFNHAGLTILFYLNDNPVTLESILYGAAAAAMLAGVILWFACYSDVFTSDKFVYLFGRVIPALSLILSMALRFVPKYRAQMQKTLAAQQALGGAGGGQSRWEKLKTGARVLSIVTTWALENAIETADSMRARGYGLKGRTAYAIYRFDGRDRLVLCLLAGLLAFVLGAMAAGAVAVRYFPSIVLNPATPVSAVAYAAHTAVCFLPVIFNAREALVWRSLMSRA